MQRTSRNAVRVSQSGGFAYIALLMVVALMGVASAATFTVGATLQRRDAEEELLFIGTQFTQAFQSYYDATPAEQLPYPMTLGDLVRDPRFPEPRRHLRRIYIDPVTGRDDWVPVASPEGGIVGVHSSSTARPMKIANFPEELRGLENRRSYAEWVFFFTPPSLGRPR